MKKLYLFFILCYCVGPNAAFGQATCATPMGDASGYTSPPTIPEVVGDCITPALSPPLSSEDVATFCYHFTATATNVDFNVIITSDCGTGNVTNFSWRLYNYPSCGASIQTGNLSDLTFNGLTIGNDYVFCYTFEVPCLLYFFGCITTCEHSQHCPFFVGAATPLPVELIGLEASYQAKKKSVVLDWTTATEHNNAYFTVEKSKDGFDFVSIDTIQGAGNSATILAYQTTDRNPYNGVSYYRLKQIDFNGDFDYSDVVSVAIDQIRYKVKIVPNPVTNNGILKYRTATTSSKTIVIYDIAGRIVYATSVNTVEGINQLSLPISSLRKGIYFLRIAGKEKKEDIKFIKN